MSAVPMPLMRPGASVRGRGIGLGGAGPLRHRKILRDNILAITKPDIRRLARRGGVRRIKKDIYDTTRDVLKSRLKQILERVVIMMLGGGAQGSGGRKVVTVQDVVFALNSMGNTLYGCGWYDLGKLASKKRNRRGRQ